MAAALDTTLDTLPMPISAALPSTPDGRQRRKSTAQMNLIDTVQKLQKKVDDLAANRPPPIAEKEIEEVATELVPDLQVRTDEQCRLP